MTVAELIEMLKSYDPKFRVVTRGYKGGYDDIIMPNRTGFDLALNVNTPSYYGPHDTANNRSKGIVEKAICL